MRSFDIVGSGGVGLMPRTADHADYFDEGRHLFLYDDAEDAIVQPSPSWLRMRKPLER